MSAPCSLQPKISIMNARTLQLQLRPFNTQHSSCCIPDMTICSLTYLTENIPTTWAHALSQLRGM